MSCGHNLNLKGRIIMETVILVVVIVCIAAYYGFMRSLEPGADIANAEVQLQSDIHAVSVIRRTGNLAEKLTDSDVDKAIEVKEKIRIMREGMKAGFKSTDKTDDA